jgi:hypothetical protein
MSSKKGLVLCPEAEGAKGLIEAQGFNPGESVPQATRPEGAQGRIGLAFSE